jgi:hypothetical protein
MNQVLLLFDNARTHICLCIRQPFAIVVVGLFSLILPTITILHPRTSILSRLTFAPRESRFEDDNELKNGSIDSAKT